MLRAWVTAFPLTVWLMSSVGTVSAQNSWGPWITISGSDAEDKCGVDYALSFRDKAEAGRRFIWYRVRNRCSSEVVVRFQLEGSTLKAGYEELRVASGRSETSWTTAVNVSGVGIAPARGTPARGSVNEIEFPGSAREWRDPSSGVRIAWSFSKGTNMTGGRAQMNANVTVATSIPLVMVNVTLWCNGDPTRREITGPIRTGTSGFVLDCAAGDATGLKILSVVK